MGRFHVTSVVDAERGTPPLIDADSQDGKSGVRRTSSAKSGTPNNHRPTTDGNHAVAERIPLCDKNESGLALYEDEYNTQGQKIGQMLRSLSLYQTVLPNAEDAESTAKAPKQQTVKLGTVMGVFLPCMQNIFGVLFFIRMAWIVGTAGIANALGVVGLCCCVTFLTSISLSAIATNGVVSGGGPYYMISRNLGPELGGAVGILFYLGTTVAASMYVIGAVEIILIYIFPQAKIFDNMYHNFRFFGSILLVIIGLIVLAGVKVVNKFALPAVLVVIACIFCTFLGIAIKFNGTDSLKFCMVGDRPVNLVRFERHHKYIPECTSEGLYDVYCPGNTTSDGGASKCDPYYELILRSRPESIGERRAIVGLSSGVFWENLWPKYRSVGDVLTKGNLEKEPPSQSKYWVLADTASSFMILVGVFFPSVTGIMAGSNRSGNLRDASRSIPVGTLGAQLTTSVVYLTGAALFGASVAEMYIRDKFGQSAMGKLVIAELAVPFPIVILIGCCLSTIGAGMQSLTGAPRLLQAISADEVIPFLRLFQKTDSRGEPIRAIFLTLAICEMGILIAVIENITALITQFFLMCYLGVNTACALQSIMKAPGWRPSFRYFHWSLSMFGALLCIAVMFISAWYFAIIALFIGAAVYKYIEYAGAEKEWGDGLKGLALSAARFALLNVDSRAEHHSRNWRPQLLVLLPTKRPEKKRIDGQNDDETLAAMRNGLMSFVSQLKAGKGLTLLAECIEGNYAEKTEDLRTAKEDLDQLIRKHRIKGFGDVLVAERHMFGISCLIQTSGLGGLRHNSVVLAWPNDWAQSKAFEDAHNFVDTLRHVSAAKCAILVPKNIDAFPTTNEKMTGTIDVWWIVHDGGLLMLLPFLLRKHKTWKNTKLRLFTIAHFDDNTVQMKKDLEKFLYHLRIEADVNVIEMPESDISEYTYERTLKIEERVKLLRGMKPREKQADIQAAMDEVVLERKHSKLERRQSSLSTSDEKTPQTAVQIDGNDVKNGPISKVRFSENSVEYRQPTFSDDGDSSERTPVRQIEEAKTPGMKAGAYNVRKMHTAVKLNELMRERSGEAQLIVVNLPGPPDFGYECYYMEFIEALTESLKRVLLVRGTGAEVVTIYS